MKFSELFKRNEFAFMPYVTLGYPNFEESLEIIKTLEPYADALELGVPFSDHLADGPVLQKAVQTALQRGFRLQQTFEAIRRIREFTQKPIAILTYINPVLAYGIGRFAQEAGKTGADAMLVPDAPLEEMETLRPKLSEFELPLFVAPTTPPERSSLIAEKAEGFVYAITVRGVTGQQEQFAEDAVNQMVKNLSGIPVMLGFGISKPEHVTAAKLAGARGVVVGSKFATAYEEGRLNSVRILAESLYLKAAKEKKR